MGRRAALRLPRRGGGTLEGHFPLSYPRTEPHPEPPLRSVALVAFAMALAAAGRYPASAVAQETPPAGFAEAELARSRRCVPALNRLEELDLAVRPYAQRMERLRALGRAVSLEDRDEAGTLGAEDAMEAAVDAWFAADSALAARYVTERDEAIQETRARERDALLDRIRQAMQEVGAQAEAVLEGAAELEVASAPCQGAVLVRSAVQEACAGSESTLCQAVATAGAAGPFRFVDAPEALWDMEDYRPWTRPGSLQGTPQGALVGARTAAQARRGNIIVAVALAPLIRGRAEISEEEVAEFQANLDALGIAFDHPLFVMAPAFEVEVSVPGPMEGETHLLLHFGDLTGDDVIWSSEIGEGGVLDALFPASGVALNRLQAGEALSLTAIRVVEGEDPEAQADAEAIYSLAILPVNQAQHVAALLQYMVQGNLGRDLAQIIPPPAGG